MADDQAQGPLRSACRYHRAQPLGPFRQDRRRAEVPARKSHLRGATCPDRQGRGHAPHPRTDARRNRRCPVQPRGLDVGTQTRRLSRARLHRRDRGQTALAKGPRARGEVSRRRRGARPTGRREHDSRWRARGIQCGRQAVVCRPAGSRAAEDGTGDRCRRSEFARGLLRLRPAVFRGNRSAPSDLRRSAALPCPVPAAVAARATRACRKRRHRVARGRARQRLRGSDRQTQGKPLRGGPALDIVAQGQADAQRGFRHRRLHEGERLAGSARRHPGRLLGPGRAALCLARRLRLRRPRVGASQGSAQAAAPQQLPVRGRAGAQRPDDLGRAGNRRRGEFPELDRGRSPARTRVPAAAR